MTKNYRPLNYGEEILEGDQFQQLGGIWKTVGPHSLRAAKAQSARLSQYEYGNPPGRRLIEGRVIRLLKRGETLRDGDLASYYPSSGELCGDDGVDCMYREVADGSE